MVHSSALGSVDRLFRWCEMRVVGIPIIGKISGSIAGLNVSLRPPFSLHNPFIRQYFFGGGAGIGGALRFP